MPGANSGRPLASIDRHIDRDSAIALHHQLREILVDLIARGEIPVGHNLPSERELEQRYRVSRITVRRAINDLVSHGYLRRESGRGTYVIRSIIEDTLARRVGTFMDALRSEGRNVTSKTLSACWQTAPERVQEALVVTPETELFRLERVIYADDRPVTLVNSWCHLPREADALLLHDEPARTNIWDALERHCGIFLTNGEQTLQAVAADRHEADLLVVAQGSPLMLVKMTLRDSRGRPILFVKVVHVGESYKVRTLVTR